MHQFIRAALPLRTGRGLGARVCVCRPLQAVAGSATYGVSITFFTLLSYRSEIVDFIATARCSANGNCGRAYVSDVRVMCE